MTVEILHGDMLDILPTLPEASFSSCVTDGPYGLRFMGKRWDYDVPSVAQWQAVLRVLKPGAILAAFGGSRTSHRLACNIEDAGFDLRDTIAWLYGTGKPKADGQLKPSHEPILLARAPFTGTEQACVAEHGTGLRIDDCRIPYASAEDREASKHWGKAVSRVGGLGVADRRERPKQEFVPGEQRGRWPANVILTCACEDHEGAPDDDCPVRLLDEQSGELKSGGNVRNRRADKHRNAFGTFKGERVEHFTRPPDFKGGASRFFYCAKAAPSERGRFNTHPTVKPIALMRYLVRLVTPPGGRVLDCFFGSGTTGLACRLEERPCVGIEREAGSIEIARKRMAQGSLDFGAAS